MDSLCNQPGRQSPNLHVVQANIVLANALCEIVQERKNRYVFVFQVLNNSVEFLIVHRSTGNRVASFAQLRQDFGELGGRLR